MLYTLNLRQRETNGDFQKMSSPDAASHLHITWAHAAPEKDPRATTKIKDLVACH